MTSERKESTGESTEREWLEGLRHEDKFPTVTDEMIERAEKALFEHAQDVWGWGSNEYADVAQAVRRVLRAALEAPDDQ